MLCLFALECGWSSPNLSSELIVDNNKYKLVMIFFFLFLKVSDDKLSSALNSFEDFYINICSITTVMYALEVMINWAPHDTWIFQKLWNWCTFCLILVVKPILWFQRSSIFGAKILSSCWHCCAKFIAICQFAITWVTHEYYHWTDHVQCTHVFAETPSCVGWSVSIHTENM